ncbi:alpha/beta hydrolase [Streptomyces sp. NPDC059629]|uniref:alpha/beta hydrolase n=1 Tax=Streptomyces sp. NPDC059629 TaxID=3346889 RepID=UPI00367AA4A6
MSVSTVQIQGEGVMLEAHLFLPDGPGPHPAVTLACGFGGVKEGVEEFARVFQDAGFVAIVHDHRGFGGSTGLRGDVNPWQQITDWRRVISYLESRPEVDADRIGIWGSSFAGGHTFVLAATDRRIKAVVAQVPTVDGRATGQRRVSGPALVALGQSFDDDERAQLRGEPPATRAVVSDDPSIPAFYTDPEAVAYYTMPIDGRVMDNVATLRSMRWARMYSPGQWIDQIGPTTPVMMLVAKHDHVTGADLVLTAYERALQPKRLVLLEGGHFDPYHAQFETASGAALEWFQQNL